MFVWWMMAHLSFQESSSSTSSFLASPPGDLLCDVLGFVPTVTSSSTLQIFWHKPLVMVAFLISNFPSLQHVQCCTPTRGFDGGCQTLTHAGLGFPFHFSFLYSELTESIQMMACVVWLSPLEAIQWRAWATASTSTVKLEVETLQAAPSSWMVVACCSIVKPQPDCLWWLSNHLAACCFLEWKPDLQSRPVYPLNAQV